VKKEEKYENDCSFNFYHWRRYHLPYNVWNVSACLIFYSPYLNYLMFNIGFPTYIYIYICIVCSGMLDKDNAFVITKQIINLLPRIIHSLRGWILCRLLNNPHYDIPITWSPTLYHGPDIISLFAMKCQTHDDRYVIMKLIIYLLPRMDWLHYNAHNFETKLDFVLTIWYSTLLYSNDLMFNIVWWGEDFIAAFWNIVDKTFLINCPGMNATH